MRHEVTDVVYRRFNIHWKWKKHGHGYWTVIIFDVRFVASTSHWLWSFYLFLFTVSLL